MSQAVDRSFTGALGKYIAADMPSDLARQCALPAADNERRIQQQVMEVEFPSRANVLEENRTVSKANTGELHRRCPASETPSPRASEGNASAT